MIKSSSVAKKVIKSIAALLGLAAYGVSFGVVVGIIFIIFGSGSYSMWAVGAFVNGGIFGCPVGIIVGIVVLIKAGLKRFLLGGLAAVILAFIVYFGIL